MDTARIFNVIVAGKFHAKVCDNILERTGILSMGFEVLGKLIYPNLQYFCFASWGTCLDNEYDIWFRTESYEGMFDTQMIELVENYLKNNNVKYKKIDKQPIEFIVNVYDFKKLFA